jgi:hypothetical protein
MHFRHSLMALVRSARSSSDMAFTLVTMADSLEVMQSRVLSRGTQIPESTELVRTQMGLPQFVGY